MLFLNSVVGLGLFALMTAAFADSLSLSDVELRLMHVVQRAEGANRIQLAAVRVIQRAWKRKANKSFYGLPLWLRKHVASCLPPGTAEAMAGAVVAPESPAPASPAAVPGAQSSRPLGFNGRLPPDVSVAPESPARSEAGASRASQKGVSFANGARNSSLPSEAGTERSIAARSTAAIRGAAVSKLEQRRAVMRNKHLARALADWRVERHRNATTSEMIENVTLFLKELRERVDEQGKVQAVHTQELMRVLKRVDLLAQHTLPAGTDFEPPPPPAPKRKGRRAAQAGATRAKSAPPGGGQPPNSPYALPGRQGSQARGLWAKNAPYQPGQSTVPGGRRPMLRVITREDERREQLRNAGERTTAALRFGGGAGGWRRARPAEPGTRSAEGSESGRGLTRPNR